jgi:hypothetical protein
LTGTGKKISFNPHDHKNRTAIRIKIKFIFLITQN